MSGLERRQATVETTAFTGGNSKTIEDFHQETESVEKQIVKELTDLNLLDLTPLKALNMIAAWQELYKEKTRLERPVGA